MRLVITETEVGDWAAKFVKHRMHASGMHADRPFVLGLPTGGTPKGMYRNLIAMHKAGELSFRHTITFNMDEYVGLSVGHPESYHSYMFSTFFDHVDIQVGNIHIPDGNASDLLKECADYESAIKNAGGVDLFIGGIGEDGHLAFNEPGSSLTSRTRQEFLTESTILANARFFDNTPGAVPRSALTVGIGTIMDAREVLILVSGAAKARALRATVEEGINHMWTASILQMHPKAVIVADQEAIQELQVKTVRYFSSLDDEYAAIGK